MPCKFINKTDIIIKKRLLLLEKLGKNVIKILFPILFGIILMLWLYRDFDFSVMDDVLLRGVNWWWMLLSLFFGVLGYVLRGIRWKQLLDPLGAHVNTYICINSVLVSYMMNIVIPRVGEVSRCGLLNRYDNVSFSKSFGTIVTERIIDTICIFLITFVVFLVDNSFFIEFLNNTGTNIGSYFEVFTSVNFYIVLLIVILAIISFIYFCRNFVFYNKIKNVFQGIANGIMSVSKVDNPILFILYTIGIWVSYFLHFYITFYCFDFTSDLGFLAGVIMFVLGSFAVIVPTPNGAGPWHYVIFVSMAMYGVGKSDAGIFALIVHSIQTFLIVLLGIIGMLLLQISNKTKL